MPNVLIIDGNPASGATLMPGVASVVITMQTPALQAQVTPGAATVSITMHAPSVLPVLSPGVASIAITMHAPALMATVEPGVASIAITLHNFNPAIVGLHPAPASIAIVLRTPRAIRRGRPPANTLARVYVHNPQAPGERWCEFCSAHDVDPATIRMDVGEARFAIYDGDPAINGDTLRAGVRIAIVQEGLPPFVGILLTARRQLSTDVIEITAAEETAILDARQVPQQLVFTKPIGASTAMRIVLDEINGRSETNLRLASNLGIAPPIEDLHAGGQSCLEFFRELHDRTNWEWWAEYDVTPSHIRTTIYFDEMQGLDLSSDLYLYEGVHFNEANWTKDASQVKAMVTAYGDFGMAVEDRASAMRTTLAYPGIAGRLTKALIQSSPLFVGTALEDLTPGLRSEQALYEVGTSSKAELARRAARSQERSMPGQETFEDDVVSSLVDLTKLRIGNTFTRISRFGGEWTNRACRVVSMQPASQQGICHVKSELWLR